MRLAKISFAFAVWLTLCVACAGCGRAAHNAVVGVWAATTTGLGWVFSPDSQSSGSRSSDSPPWRWSISFHRDGTAVMQSGGAQTGGGPPAPGLSQTLKWTRKDSIVTLEDLNDGIAKPKINCALSEDERTLTLPLPTGNVTFRKED